MPKLSIPTVLKSMGLYTPVEKKGKVCQILMSVFKQRAEVRRSEGEEEDQDLPRFPPHSTTQPH